MANPIRFKRGPSSGLNFTPAAGEPIFVTDTKEVRVGDASTAGGIPLVSTSTSQTISGAKTFSTFPVFGQTSVKSYPGLSCFSTGAKAAKTYRKLFSMPVSSASNNGIVTLKGLLSGYTFANGKSDISIVFQSRDYSKPSATILGKLGLCDIAMYREASNSFSVYAVADVGSIHAWNITLDGDFSGGVLAATYEYSTSVETTTIPTGTLEWLLSTGYITRSYYDNNGNTGLVLSSDQATTNTSLSFRANSTNRTVMTQYASDGLFKLRSFNESGTEIDQPLIIDNTDNMGKIQIGNTNTRQTSIGLYNLICGNMDPAVWDVDAKSQTGLNLGWNRSPGLQKTTLINRTTSVGTNGGYSFRRYDGTTETSLLELDYNGDTTIAGKMIKSGGTTSQFLKANGDVDSNTYLTQTKFNADNADLAAIEALSGTDGVIKKYAGTWFLDTGYFSSKTSGNSVYGDGFNGAAMAGSGNTIIGTHTTSNVITGGNNVSIGYGVLSDSLTSGSYNVAIGGGQTMNSVTTGSNNIAIGGDTMRNVTTGSYNVMLGSKAGMGLGAIAANNTFIGGGAGANVSNTLIIDAGNINRASDATGALIYATANATTANQTIALNAAVDAVHGLKVGGVAVVTQATKTREIVVQMEGISNSAPSVANFVDANNSCLVFTGTATTNNLYGSIDMQHDYIAGTSLDMHLHWAPTTTGAGNVKWQLYYQWCETGSTWAAATLTTVTTAAGGTAWADKLSVWTIAGTGKTYNSRLKLRLFRNPADAADTYPDPAAYVQLGVHYQVNLGQA